MDTLDYIKQELAQLFEDTIKLPFTEKDARRAFHDRILDTLDNYYKSLSVVLFFFNGGQFRFNTKTENFTEHLLPFQQDFASWTVATQSYRNYINRSMIMDSWSIFENSITLMCKVILSEEVKEELILEKFNNVKKIVGLLSDPGTKESALRKELEVKHLSSVSITRKYEKLFNLVKDNYSRNVKDDKAFLKFYGAYRNVVHSNYIFYGKDFTHPFQGVPIIFKNGELVGDGEGKMNEKRMFDLVLELRSVFMELMAGLKITKEILEK